jgi:hypothetical protein
MLAAEFPAWAWHAASSRIDEQRFQGLGSRIGNETRAAIAAEARRGKETRRSWV